MRLKHTNFSISLVVLLLAFVSVSCMEDVDTDPKNLIGRWRMEKVIENGKTFLKPERPSHHHEVELEFLENGEIEGTMPLDEFFGSYKVSGEDSILIEGRQMSKVGIPQWGFYFYYSFPFVKTFSLKKEGITFRFNELHLYHIKGELIFERIK